MAKIIGGITTSHIPAIGNAIANESLKIPIGNRFSTAIRRSANGWQRTSRMW